MTIIILFLAVAAALATGAVRLALHDGRGYQRPPSSHAPDPQLLAPGSLHSSGIFR